MVRVALVGLVSVSLGLAVADAGPNPRAAMDADRAQAMAKLSFMTGVWIGNAHGVAPNGQPYEVVQTERMGPMLGGDIIVIEGRGYAKDGAVVFNAFGVASYNVFTKSYEMRSYAQGFGGTFPLRLTPDGFGWETPAGPGAITRFTATVGNGVWHEVGERIAEGQPPVRNFEMTLKRVGETDWPAGNPVTPQQAR